ncbi:hypothetical protein Acr_25g0003140 [Actinidia rufa]|uniref:Uncharacterized protein n=1 Tax=Actinidia rufa TaxID=165716 RepID=A0A7J0GYJ8_9ERIC|nr:hypothetical protein Acr_25g0003140 [Actinidia rufa]
MNEDHATTLERLEKEIADLREKELKSHLLKSKNLQMTSKRLWNSQLPSTLTRASTYVRSRLGTFILSSTSMISKSTPELVEEDKEKEDAELDNSPSP